MAEELTRQLVQKISDGTVTIREFMDAALEMKHASIKGFVSAVSTDLKNSGIDLDSSWKSLTSDDVVMSLIDLDNPHTRPTTFVNIQAIERENKKFYRTNKKLITEAKPYIFTTANELQITGDDGVARSFGDKASNPKGYQARKSLKFKKVPKASITIPKIVEAASKIKDLNARRAVVFNILVPFRPGEVAGLKLSDVDLETGYIKEWKRGNKTRSALTIPEVALEILRDAAEEAQAAGRQEIFNTTTSKMTAGIKQPGGLKELMEVHLATLGRSVRGSSDIRKLIPSLLVQQLGAEGKVVSAIMGHDSGQAILADLARESAAHYISPIEEGIDSVENRGLRALQGMLAQNIDAVTFNELPEALGVSAKRLTAAGAEALVVPDLVTDTPETRKTFTPEEKALRDARAKLSLERIQQESASAKTSTLTAEMEALELREKIATRTPQVIATEAVAAEKATAEKLVKDTGKQTENKTKNEAARAERAAARDASIPDELKIKPTDTIEEKRVKTQKLANLVETGKVTLKGLGKASILAAPLLAVAHKEAASRDLAERERVFMDPDVAVGESPTQGQMDLLLQRERGKAQSKMSPAEQRHHTLATKVDPYLIGAGGVGFTEFGAKPWEDQSGKPQGMTYPIDIEKQERIRRGKQKAYFQRQGFAQQSEKETGILVDEFEGMIPPNR